MAERPGEPFAAVMGKVYGAFEASGVADYVARDVVTRMQAVGVVFVDQAEFVPSTDAWTTRGSRNPNTLLGRGPIAAYNLGYQEGRASVTDRTGEPDPDVVGWDDQKPRESREAEPAKVVTTARIAVEPIEDRLHRAWLNGYREGSQRAAHDPRWDHS